MTDRPPFVIHALGRSRTAWLSKFLTYGDWSCLHEQAIHLRDPAELAAHFAKPKIGYAETAASFGWPLIVHARPDIVQVVVNRDPAEAAQAMGASYEKAGLQYNAEMMRLVFERGHRVLKKISALPGTLTVSYRDLDTEEGCRAVFERCLPYAWDRAWWCQVKDQHIEADILEMVAYYWANRDVVEGFKALCRKEMFRLARTGELKHALH